MLMLSIRAHSFQLRSWAKATRAELPGPYTYKGIFMGNPSINGQNINANNNNHHGIAEFKGHWYVAYHDRRIANGYDGLEKIPAEDGKANPNPAYHRSVSVDEFTYNSDGTMKELTFTKEGPKQIANFDPYDWYPALTSSKPNSSTLGRPEIFRAIS